MPAHAHRFALRRVGALAATMAQRRANPVA